MGIMIALYIYSRERVLMFFQLASTVKTFVFLCDSALIQLAFSMLIFYPGEDPIILHGFVEEW